MKRYLKVIRLFWSAAISTEMEYRLNFIIATLTSLGNLVGSIFGLFLFYRQDYTFPGWSWEASLIVLGVFTLLQGFSASFLSPNLNRIVRHVQEGTLDFILLKPIRSQFWLSTHTLSPWGLPDLIFGCIIIVYAGQRLGLGIRNYFLSIFPLICGLVILYSLWFILGSTTVWFVKIYNVTEVLRGLLEAGRYPIVAYPTTYRVFFTFIVPVAFLTTVPAQVLLGESSLTWLIGAVFLAGLLFFISTWFWRFALRFYTSASS
ncbi:MAG: ABC transporter permease [Sphaerospermopsis sp. SIO1G2]|nr:ABC transporter permease [Sphaerospermopsis sp. SIO1G1]NET69536.1 ABC transporter permease [Sphaerospermopsis sp. SIO1G2]